MRTMATAVRCHNTSTKLSLRVHTSTNNDLFFFFLLLLLFSYTEIAAIPIVDYANFAKCMAREVQICVRIVSNCTPERWF